jgi:hypothetical protein
MAWGNIPRHCGRCGKVGPRVQHSLGWVHYRCLTTEELKERRIEQGRGGDNERLSNT